MRKLFRFSLAFLLILAAGAQARVGVQKLTLDPTTDAEKPVFAVLDEEAGSLRLEIRLPLLNVEEIMVGDEIYQALTIPGGDIRGEAGQAGLPVFTRLVVVPDNAAVTVRVLDHERQVLPGYRVLPVQPDDGEEFVIDRDYYAEVRSLAPPAVEVGDPAIFHRLRVVPVTFSPVEFDPKSGELTVCSRMEVELDFSGRDLRNAAARQRSRIPESFHRIYQDVVINYDSFMDRNEAQVCPGTYLLIYPPESGVLTRLQPLIDWRKRQGYNVLTASTNTTGSTNSLIKTYIQNIYDTVDPPLEFVALAGDANGTYDVPCWFESLSGYGGEGDHYYTTLEGSDILADVHIGRLSFRDLSTLEAIVDKIVTYESNPPTSDTGWFTRAGLTGDRSSSGITCIYVNQWVKTQLLAAGYTQIDTIFTSPWVSQMTNSINQGLTVFTYRGFLNMSGMGTSNILGLSNGYKLPFAVIVTCDTGSFSDDATCRSEAFLRNANGGGIGSVGSATWGTHTRYNNCYFNGVWDGAINGSEHRLGASHTRGKLNLYLNYQTAQPNKVDIWSMWNTLMGDPATDMWTGYPAGMTVEYPDPFPVDANSAPVTVTVGTIPLEDALVTLYKAGEIQVSGYTDFAGRVNLPISASTAGEMLVTVTKHNRFPHLGSLTLGSVGTFVGYHDSVVDDDLSGGSSGNNDGIVNPAENIELSVALHNYGTSGATGVTATLSTLDTYVTITDSEENFGDIGADATVWSAEDFDFSVDPATPDGHVLDLDLVASSLSSDWTSLIQLTVQSAAFSMEDFTWGGGGGSLDPGESGSLSIEIRNLGSILGAGVTGELSTESPWIEITDANGSFGSIGVGSTAENASDPFALIVSGDCFKGHQANFTLTLTFNGQAQDIVEFTLTVGNTTSSDPVGPDAYGYYAFDNTDVGYPFAPTYNWLEIDPNYGGSGTDVGLSDFGWEQDDTRIMDLPFIFRFYGQDYDEISICSNGWVVMGRTYLKHYCNRALPSSGSPDALICPMWDNLYQTGSNRVYYLNDTVNHRYVIQWSRVKNDYSNATQNFEMILYDPNFYPTSSGDGEILFQYATVNNTDSRDGYVTVGIQNQDHTDGLLYTYWNHYEPGAATLSSGRAIRILPVGAMAFGTLEGDITNTSNGGTPIQGVNIRVLEANQTLVSDSDGHYFGSVQEGTYTVRAEHYSFDPVTETDVEIIEDQTTVLDFSLTDILGPEISNTTVHPCTDDTDGPYVIETYITDFSTINERHLYYKINGSGQFEVPLVLIDAETGLHRGEIPGYPFNTEISYWVEAEDIVTNESRDPEGTDTYDFWILNSVTIFADDMEDDQGWTVGDAGDDASAGIWERVDPNGVWEGATEVQPEDDATPPTGIMCYITGNDPPGSSQGTDDVDGGKTTLLSPWFDLSGVMEAFVSYRRWYTNDTGYSPGEDYWVVQVTDNGSNWVNLENTNTSDRSWALKTFVLDDYVELTSTVRFRFIASDEGDGSVVEAGVDEFELIGFQTMTLSGNVSAGELVLDWTAIPGTTNYWVHGADNDVYFEPSTGNRLAIVPGETITWSSANGIEDSDHNWTYLVLAVDASEQEINRSNRYGEYDVVCP